MNAPYCKSLYFVAVNENYDGLFKSLYAQYICAFIGLLLLDFTRSLDFFISLQEILKYVEG